MTGRARAGGWWPSSLKLRLAVWYALLLTTTLAGFTVVCYAVFARASLDRTDRFIGDALTAFAREVTAERRVAMSAAQAIRSTVEEVRFRDLHVYVFDPAGAPVSSTEQPEPGQAAAPAPGLGQRLQAAITTPDAPHPAAFTLRGDTTEYRVVARPLTVAGERFILAGAYSLADSRQMLARVRDFFFLALPFLIILSATTGYFLANKGLAPVASMTRRAAEISATNLHERLPVEGGDELAALSRVVNGLLDRIEASFEQQRRFVTDASHELRTPAAILRTEADVTLSRDHRSEDEYRGSMAVMRDAARRLARIVDDLFLLARADAGGLALRRSDVYLDELVCDAIRAVRSVAEERSVRVELGQVAGAPVSADPDLVGRVLLNLLDNAIKYSPADGEVRVDLSAADGRYQVTVSDEGPGIPSEAQPRIFERFFRVDTARSRSESSQTSGAGLGLAIARRIAEMHGGTLDLVESRPGRTTFRFSLSKGG